MPRPALPWADSPTTMNRTTALASLLTVCLVLSVLLVTGTIGRLVGGLLFAAALVVLGVASRGFRGV